MKIVIISIILSMFSLGYTLGKSKRVTYKTDYKAINKVHRSYERIIKIHNETKGIKCKI